MKIIYKGLELITAERLMRFTAKASSVFHVAITSDGDIEIFPGRPADFKVLEVDDDKD